MKTIKFFANLGFNEGYFHENADEKAQNLSVESIWQEKAAEVFNESNIYIGAVFSKAKTVYHEEWGCPKGGEETYFITGECNPNYTSLEKYKEAVLAVLERTAKILRQSTTQVTFIEAEFVYLDFR